MKVLYCLHGLLYAYLLYLGFFYLGLDEQLWGEFDRVGWQNYSGLDLDYPENTYYAIWSGCSVVSFFLALMASDSKSSIALLLKGFAAFFFISYVLLYWSDGRISLQEAKIGWVFSASLQIILSVVFCLDWLIVRVVDLRLKYIWAFNALGYLSLLLLGNYFLQMDNGILEEIRSVGWGNYEGVDKDYPENTYHAILVVATIGSLLLIVWAEETNVILTTYKWLMIVFFLYGTFVYINDGNPDMRETRYWWRGLCLTASAVSALLYFITEDKLPPKPEKDKFYGENILDDLSRLE
ncbi:hypothetical protein [Aureispira anguillae]|uniref:Uncharacterized protein n=1 Tax=Aureispira anguillae TaxID=2864201 RepID=A0A915YJA2_9BACT|nr:hypothetical protein [Aureispira anguillae]BDS14219.1 hypothetical protein AsAng_0049970 [Aureispira anguillae]